MARLLVVLFVASITPAAWAAEEVRLAVRLTDPASTGFKPLEVDRALQQAFTDLALNVGGFELAREYEAQVVASVRGEGADGKYRLRFTLETNTEPLLRDAMTIELASPELAASPSRAIAFAVVHRAQALQDQVAAQRVTTGELVKLEPRSSPSGTTLPEKPPPPRTWGLLDVEVSGGLNTPAGFIGGRLELHPLQYFSLAFASGWSSWGPRVTPGVRVYPFGLSLLGVFGEFSVEQSLGEATTVTRGGEAVSARLLPTTTLVGLVGIRQQFIKYLVVGVYVGWGFRVITPNVRDSAGATDASLSEAVDARQPGGLVAGASVGVSLF